MPHVSSHESDHKQVDNRIENEDRPDTEARNRAGNDRAGGAAEHAGAGQQGETRTSMLAWNDMMRRAQRERERAPRQQRQDYA